MNAPRRGYDGADSSIPPAPNISDPPGERLDQQLKRAARLGGDAKTVVGVVAGAMSFAAAAILWGITRPSTAYVDESVRAVETRDMAVHAHQQAEINAINENRAAMVEMMRAQREEMQRANEQLKEIRGYLIKAKP